MARHSKSGVRGLHRDAKGRYRLDLRWREAGTGETRRYSQRLPVGLTAAAAKQRAREILNAALAGGFDPKRQAPRKLGVVLDEYLRWAEANRPLTLNDRKSLVRILRARLGDPRIDQISPFMVERFKRDRRAEGVGPATVNRAVAMLKHALGLAASWGWVSSDKASAVRAVKLLKEPPGRVRYLAGDEEQRLLGALPPALHAVAVAALQTGARMGELLSLKKSSVDLANGIVLLMKTKNNRIRPVPIKEELRQVLVDAMASSPCEFVFTNDEGERWKSSTVKDSYRRSVKRAKVEDLHFHDLRHDFATKLRRENVQLDVIGQLLGHSSLSVTQRYAHVGSQTLKDAIDSLPPLSSVAIAAPLPSGTKR